LEIHPMSDAPTFGPAAWRLRRACERGSHGMGSIPPACDATA